ncbi:MAG TPA: universal stress protein [Gemmatimonadales bacterium]|nr:universal stress protein [Gemmatimonadales bacterium]
MILQPGRTGVPPPPDTQMVVPVPARQELLWGERVRTSLTGPLLIAAEPGGQLEGPVRLAELLARRHRVNAHVLAVVGPMPTLTSRLVSSATGLPGQDLDQCRRRAARGRVRAQVNELAGPSGFLSTSAELGEMVPTVSAAARGRDASYVLTDIAPPRDPRRISTAAAALRLAEDAGTPVLAVPPATDDLPRSALVCTDFTDASTRAALAAAPLMAARGELTLVHVARPVGLSADSDWVSSWTEWATARLRKLAERLGAAEGLRVYLLLLRGDAESVITRSVANFDLVALGASDPARPRLGLGAGVSAAVLRHAPGTVLIAPDPAAG